MRLRLALLVSTMVPALTGGAMLGAQQPSAYVPLGDWTMPYVEHLIAMGVIDDPSLMQGDRAHPNAAGAHAIADTIWPHLDQLTVPLQADAAR